MKHKAIHDYIWDNVLEDNEIKDILNTDYNNKIVFNTFIALYDNLLSSNSYDEELSNIIFDLTKNNNSKEIYEILKKEYLYRYVKINVKSTEFPKDLKRIMYIPLRSNVYELMIAVLSTLNTLGEHLLSIGKDRINFITPCDESGSGYEAIDTYTVDILNLKKLKLWYDYGEDWVFNIDFDKLEYLDEYVSFKIVKFKGKGIIEDNKYLLYSFLYNPESKHYDDFDDYDFSDYYDETLKEITDRSLADYEILLIRYSFEF